MSTLTPLAPAAVAALQSAQGEGVDDSQASADIASSVDDALEWPTFGHLMGERSGHWWQSYLAIDGMYCAACAITLEQALMRVEGVESVVVSVAGQKARVVWDATRTRPSTLLAAVAQAGYAGRPVANAVNETQRRSDTRRALWRWLVAGLCMMQVMMYAYPSYVATTEEMGSDAQYLLRWASWLISLPVVLFSSRSFFEKAWRDVRRGSLGMDLPVAVGIAITFLVSTAGTFDPNGTFGHEVYFDSLTMFVFFLLSGRLLELRLRDRVFFAMDSALHKMPQSVQRVLADGRIETVSAKRVKVGDCLMVATGQAFAADGIVVQGSSHVDESVLTGESLSISKTVGERTIAGSINLGAPLLVRVEKTGEQTQLGEILALMANAQTARPGYASLADRLAKPFLITVMVLAGLTAAIGWADSPERALMAAVAVLIVTCPCALSLSTPAALLVSVGRLAKMGMLVKRIESLEALSQADTVVFDKTGTLTTAAYSPRQAAMRDGMTESRVMAMAYALAQHSAHPLSKALVDHCRLQPAGYRAPPGFDVTEVKEVPGGGMSGVLHSLAGGPAIVLRLGSAAFCGVAPGDSASTKVMMADAQGWLATLVFDQTLRPDALQTVQQLHDAGMQLAILSGDNQQATAEVAQALGIVCALGRLSPMDKLRHIQALQRQGRRVVMVGDGVNDAPVLAAANVSVSLGSAVALAQNQCDVLIQKGGLVALLVARRQALVTMTVVRKNLAWALGYNALAVPMALAGYLPAWAAGLGMALSSLLVIANAARLARLPA